MCLFLFMIKISKIFYAHFSRTKNRVTTVGTEGQFGMVGALFGVTLQLYANGAMKRPLVRPWMHVIFAGVGLLGGPIGTDSTTEER